MQLHPKDTRGSFFEIDCQLNGMEPDGPWEPAGEDWQRCRRTDVIDAITAAEIQTPDVAEVAGRWSAIAEIELAKDVSGRTVMPLENAEVRFVEPSDGRPEGLGGIDVNATDRQRALERAEARGRRAGDDLVLVCGTRIRLV